MKNIWFLLLAFTFTMCTQKTESEDGKSPSSTSVEKAMTLNRTQAEEIVNLPLACVDIEYPNKLNQVIGGEEDLRAPEDLHPAFYGCFDWHSAVHGHWSLVRLVRTFPDLEERERIIVGLQNHITAANIAGEMKYFDSPLSQGFERMYGWAWLLKLAEELHRWDVAEARELEKNLQPLTDLIIERVEEFLPKLHYPVRVGTHTNTAFALSLMYDYADAVGNQSLKTVIEKRSREYYLEDSNCPLTWEPGGTDFLSPCFEEANLMRKILPKAEFKRWLEDFLPGLEKQEFTLEPAIVTDRTDGHLVHLDGLNYSRAWCLFGIAETLPEYAHLRTVANNHIKYSLPDLTDGNYEGGHWLASFALMALTH